MNDQAIQFQPTDDELTAMRLHALSDRVLLVNVSLSAFTNRRQDDRATSELCTSKSAQSGSVSVSKIALSKAHLSPVTQRYSVLRELVNRHTSIWSGDGWRLIPADQYQAFVAKLKEAFSEMMAEVDVICSKWEQVIEENRQHLGDLFDRSMYPTAEEFRECWGMDIKVQQVPSTDVRVAMDDASVRDLSEQIHSYVTAQYAGVLSSGMEKLAEKVRHAATVLSDQPTEEKKRRARLFDSLLDNVKAQASIMRSLATSIGDKKMLGLINDIDRDLLRFTTDQLRANPQLRDRVGVQATALARKVEEASADTTAQVGQLTEELSGFGGES